MKEADFPNYYKAADLLSIESQKLYVNIVKINLLSMIIASALSIYNFQSTQSKLIIYVTVGLLLFLSLILTIVQKSKKYEDVWYQSRALSESCKTLTWRFITCSEYFDSSLALNEAKKRFIDRIKELTNEFSELTKVLDSQILSEPIITQTMIDFRQQSTIQRKSNYIENRIVEQKKWYSDKAKYNLKESSFWFWIILGTQSLALIFIVFSIKCPENDWNFVGLLTTLSASAISWVQLKQHQELKQAYTVAAQELNFIVSLADNILTDEDLLKFVLDSENAISREHTMWIVQRRK